MRILNILLIQMLFTQQLLIGDTSIKPLTASNGEVVKPKYTGHQVVLNDQAIYRELTSLMNKMKSDQKMDGRGGIGCGIPKMIVHIVNKDRIANQFDYFTIEILYPSLIFIRQNFNRSNRQISSPIWCSKIDEKLWMKIVKKSLEIELSNKSTQSDNELITQLIKSIDTQNNKLFDKQWRKVKFDNLNRSYYKIIDSEIYQYLVNFLESTPKDQLPDNGDWIDPNFTEECSIISYPVNFKEEKLHGYVITLFADQTFQVLKVMPYHSDVGILDWSVLGDSYSHVDKNSRFEISESIEYCGRFKNQQVWDRLLKYLSKRTDVAK